MPSKSPAQAKLMRAVAHGWKPDRIKGPSRSVAREFANADRKYSGGFAENRYWTGGLAAMNEVNSGVPQTLNFQEGGPVGTGYLDYYGNEPQVLDLGNFKDVLKIGAMQAEGWQFEEATGTMYPPLWNIETGGLEQTILGETQPTTTTTTAPTTTGIGTPYTSGMAWDWGGFGNYDDWRQNMIDNGIMSPDPEPAPVRDIPGAGNSPPALSGGGSDEPVASKWTPAQIAAWEAQQTAKERQSPYRDQLREHKARVASALQPGSVSVGGGTGGNMMSGQMVPPGAIGGDLQNPIYGAEGGYMNYQEGGTAGGPRKPDVGGGAPIPGHQEGTNPHVPGTAMYRMWEDRYHIAPPPPPPPPPPEEEPGFWSSLFSSETEDLKTRSQRELEAMGEARGGHVRRFQGGGLARVAPPVGGVPPWVEPAGYMEPEGYQAGGPAAPQWSGAQRQQWRGAAGNPAARQKMRGAYNSYTPEQQAGYTGRVGYQKGPQPGNRLAAMQAEQGRHQQALMQRQGAPQQNRMAQMQADQQNQQQALQQQQMQPAVMPGGGQMIGGGQGVLPGEGDLGNYRKSIYDRPFGNLRDRMSGQGTPPTPGGPGRWSPQQRSQWGGAGAAERGAMSDQYSRGQALRNQPGGGGITGGARVPPNMRGFLQKQRMMNRPPSNVGGGVNRVGQQDQQGGLSRAMQRGTGRRPMSRRGGFPGGGTR